MVVIGSENSGALFVRDQFEQFFRQYPVSAGMHRADAVVLLEVWARRHRWTWDTHQAAWRELERRLQGEQGEQGQDRG